MVKICDNCENCLIGTYKVMEEERHEWACIFGKELLSYGFNKCSHFKAKPIALQELQRVQKETKNSELNQQAEKALDKKG